MSSALFNNRMKAVSEMEKIFRPYNGAINYTVEINFGDSSQTQKLMIKMKILKNILLIFILFLFPQKHVLSQWEATSWRSDPAIYQFAVSGNTIVIENSHDHIIISLDRGKNWQIIDNDLPYGTNLGVNAMAIKDSTIFLSTYGDLYVSENNGNTWQKRNSGLPDDNVIQNFSFMGDKIFVSTWHNGIFLSTNKGKSWEPKNNGLETHYIHELEVTENIIITSLGDSIYKSSDWGDNWEFAGNGLPNYFVYGKFVTIGDKIFVSTLNDGGTSKLYLSTDVGKTWTEKNGSVLNTYEFSIESVEERLLVGTGDSLYYSDDFGESWISSSLIKDGKRGAENFAVSDGIIYASSGVQLYKSSDKGENWFPMRDSISYGWIDNLKSYKNEIYVSVMPEKTWVTYPDGLFMTNDSGISYIQKGLENKWVLSLEFYDNYIFAGTNHGLFRSPDNGTSWEQLDEDIIANFIIRSGNKLLIPGIGGYLESTDLGNTWINKDDKWSPKNYVRKIHIEDDFMIAGLDSSVYISFDKGDSWENRSNGLPKLSLFIDDIVIIKDRIFIGTDYGIYVSSDMGENWQPKSNGLPLQTLDFIRINSLISAGNYLFAAVGSGGIYFSSDFGENWQYINTIIFGNQYVTSLLIKDDFIFASTAGPVPGTKGSGIYKAKLFDFGITDVNEHKSSIGTILYPNPASSFITISESDTKFYSDYEIYDISGRCLRKETLDSYRIDISALERGSYYLRLNSPAGSATAGFIKIE